MSGSAREAILRRVRDANAVAGRGPANTPPPPEQPVRPAPDRETMLRLFVERASDYEATVRRVAAAEIPAALAEICEHRNLDRLVIPADLPGQWLPEGVEALPDSPRLSPRRLDEIGAAFTGARLAIAATGTIVFDAGPRQGRRALTLVPDIHICLIEADSVVYGVDEAFVELASSLAEGRPVTFASGPSATSDIELNRVEGVHGPRILEILLAS